MDGWIIHIIYALCQQRTNISPVPTEPWLSALARTSSFGSMMKLCADWIVKWWVCIYVFTSCCKKKQTFPKEIYSWGHLACSRSTKCVSWASGTRSSHTVADISPVHRTPYSLPRHVDYCARRRPATKQIHAQTTYTKAWWMCTYDPDSGFNMWTCAASSPSISKSLNPYPFHACTSKSDLCTPCAGRKKDNFPFGQNEF